MVTGFSGLETKGHAFGAFVLHLIAMLQIRATIRNLKIVLLRSEVIFRYAYTFEIFAIHVQQRSQCPDTGTSTTHCCKLVIHVLF
jgi:hypothetical protein